jgi:hypothetical protein
MGKLLDVEKSKNRQNDNQDEGPDGRPMVSKRKTTLDLDSPGKNIGVVG